MKEARFLVEFQEIASELVAPAAQAGRKSKTEHADASAPEALSLADFSTSSGFETVELMIAPNPGQPARPLRRIASGGELSRIMLALKTILAQADRVSVLVFDEIDANVGGRMGSIIGEKLRTLASIHQVLCITHLPQIAAFADRHLTIRKATSKNDTLTTVTVMEGEGAGAGVGGDDFGESALRRRRWRRAQELLETAGAGSRRAGAESGGRFPEFAIHRGYSMVRALPQWRRSGRTKRPAARSARTVLGGLP